MLQFLDKIITQNVSPCKIKRLGHKLMNYFTCQYQCQCICQSQCILPAQRVCKCLLIKKKNPAYGRQSISRPMPIVAPMPQQSGPRIPKNPNFLKNGKNHPKRKNSKTSRDMSKLAIYPSTRGLSSIGKRGFQHVLKGKISKKTKFFLRGDFRPLPHKNFQI